MKISIDTTGSSHDDNGIPGTLPMNESPQDRKTRLRRLRLLIVMLPIVVLLAGRLWLHMQEQSAIQRVRDAGYPLTAEELQTWYDQAAGARVADVYSKAFDALVLDETLTNQLPWFNDEVAWSRAGEPLDAAIATAARQLLDANAQAMRFIDEATAMDTCRFPLDFAQGADLDLPHLGQLRNAMLLLQIKAELAAHDERLDDATKAVAQLFRLVDAVRDEPNVFSLLVQVNIESRAMWTVERLMCERDLGDENLATLAATIAARHIEQGFVRAMVGQRCLILIEMDSSMGPWHRNMGIFIPDKLTFMREMETLIADAQQRTTSNRGDWRMQDREIPRYAPMTAMSLPGITIIGDALTMNEATLRCAQVGVAVKRYRTAHNQLPVSLDELVPQYLDAVPLDPYDGKPLRYVTRDDGAIVWSIFEDEIDNAGVEFDADGYQWTDGTDIVFRVDLPEPPPPESESQAAEP
jgi:hypothetical protein